MIDWRSTLDVFAGAFLALAFFTDAQWTMALMVGALVAICKIAGDALFNVFFPERDRCE